MNTHNSTDPTRAEIETLYQAESRRIFATLIRLLGDFELAEEALQEAFKAALEQWPQGMPNNPRAWLVSTGRFKAIDTLRRRARFEAAFDTLAESLEQTEDSIAQDDAHLEDDRLRLIFICCHPVLSQEARVALTLREVCGLTTEAIAHAFFTTPTTMAQRIVRAKAKIRDARLSYEVPPKEELPQRLEAVLQVIYLVFNEGYYPALGGVLVRPDLSQEAIRLGRLLVTLLPEPEAIGLLALMLLHESRRLARLAPDGEMVRLEEQDRTLWDRGYLAEGLGLVRQALDAGPAGAYVLQAALAAVHASALSYAATNWDQIVQLYDLLLQAAPSPLVQINRAAAIAMRDGPQAGLDLMERILANGELANYPLAHAARADLYKRLGRTADAQAAYHLALSFPQPEPARRFLLRQLAHL